MSDRYPGAFLVSLMLHGAIAGLILLAGYAAGFLKPDPLIAVELVAGEGDNFAATEAPALGEPAALKMDVPKAVPEPPKQREVAPPEPAPVPPAPAPVEKSVPKIVEDKPVPKAPDFAKAIEKKIDRAEAKTKAALAKQHEAEAKKAAAITKEAFDKAQAGKKKAASTTPSGPPKIAQIDTKGIREGVVGGSTKNDKGGAGGKALVRDNSRVLDAYFAMLKDKLRQALEKPPGLSESLVTMIELRINPDGSLVGKIAKSSGSDEFDAAVMTAIAATRMPPHPERKSEVVPVPFRMKEQD